MGGTVVIVVLLVVVVPVAIMLSGMVAAGLLGYALKTDVDKEFEGSELLELSESN